MFGCGFSYKSVLASWWNDYVKKNMDVTNPRTDLLEFGLRRLCQHICGVRRFWSAYWWRVRVCGDAMVCAAMLSWCTPVRLTLMPRFAPYCCTRDRSSTALPSCVHEVPRREMPPLEYLYLVVERAVYKTGMRFQVNAMPKCVLVQESHICLRTCRC